MTPQAKETLAYRPGYLVVLESSSSVDAPYSPYITGQQALDQHAFITLPHGFPKEGLSCLQSLWYAIHLPPTFFDLLDLSCLALKNRQPYDFAHDIVLAPLELIEKIPLEAYRHRQTIPMLMFAPDSAHERARIHAAKLGMKIDVVKFSSLSGDMLPEHWRKIHQFYLPDLPALGKPPELTDRLDTAPLLLPLRALLRQVGDMNDVSTPTSDASFQHLLRHALHIHAVMNATARLEREGRTIEEAEPIMEQAIREERKALSIPIVMTVPGVSSAYLRKVSPDDRRATIKPWSRFDPNDRFDTACTVKEDHLIERGIIEFLSTHRAIARSGLGITMPSLPPRLFEILGELERHCASANKMKASAIWRWLGQIGEIISGMLDADTADAIRHASSITIFSNYPIGLGVLPGDTSPIMCRAPIAYRPILPLTRALQHELTPPPMVYIGAGFKVMIAECISSSDPVGQISRGIWKVISEHMSEDHRIEVIHVEAESAAQLVDELGRHSPEVLVLSAHGWFNEHSNAAGIQIGKDRCFGPELTNMPPLVLLSACHVAPRGASVVNLADLLIREGAIAVLGTQIPVHVARNALLMSRFFTNLLEVMGGREKHRSIDEIWHRVATGNVFNDILTGNESLQNWATCPFHTSTVLQSFMMERSVGRLRLGHIYEDTETVLIEMAREQGIESQVKQWLVARYIPETLFYSFTGWPERIVVADNDVAALANDVS